MTDRDRPSPRPRPAPQTEDPARPSTRSQAPTAEATSTPPAETRVPSEPTPPRRRRGAVPTVQLNTRVSEEISDLVQFVTDERGWSKREAVEHALKTTFKKEYQALMKRESEQAR